MMKRKTIALVLCLALILGLTACGTPQEAPKAPIKKAETVRETNTDWAKGSAVTTADSKYYVQQNNLRITEINLKAATEDDYGSRYIQISGLKNRDVENSINKEIKDTFFALMESRKNGELPARRGLALEAEKYDLTSPTNQYAYCYTGANFSNILSVYMYASASYPLKEQKADDDEYYYNLAVSSTECLNFDLNTGKQIKLADLAVDGEGLDYFNKKMAESLQRSDASEEGYYYYGMDEIWFKLAGEFPGLAEDQKYYISEYGNNVTLIFDELTPWIQTSDYGYASYSLPLNGVSALSQRFASSTSLFDDEEVVYALLPNGFDESGYVSIDSYDDFDYDARLEGTEIYTWSEYSYYEDMPDEIVEYVFGDQDLKEKYNKEALDVYNAYKAKGYDVGGSIDDNGYSNHIGDITYVSWYYYAYIYNRAEYGSLYSKNVNYTWNFRDGDTKPMKYEDFFKPGVDARALTIDAQVKGFRNTEPLYDWYLENLRKEVKEEDLRAFLGELYDGGFTYAPSYNSLYLTFNQDCLNELAAKYFPEFADDTWALTSGIYSLNYKDLGCSNLTLFD